MKDLETPLPGLKDVAEPGGMERAVQALGPEPTACLICRHPSPRRAFERSGKWFWSCTGCGLVFVHDIYPEFARFDEEAYGDHVVSRARPGRREQARWRRILGELETVRTTGRLLEVGCGEGNFLAAARDAGWGAVGIEILEDLARYAREELGLDARGGDLLEAAFDDASFDVVYMNEVIEHVVDPVELMTEVRRVLRPGGVAVVRTGNALSWSARMRRGAWWYYQFCGHGHIRFYSPRAARTLARAAGFSSVDSRTRGFAFRDATEMPRGWLRPVVRLAQAPLSPLARMAGAGHGLAMWFRR